MSDHTPDWQDVGSVEALSTKELQEVMVAGKPIALSFVGGVWGAISSVCNHVGGPLGQGRLTGEFVTCPWHHWRFHRLTGEGEPGFEDDRVPRHEVRVTDGRVWIDAVPVSKRHKRPHPPHPLAKIVARGEPGGAPLDAPLRVLGVSCTNMDEEHPRFSTSDHLLSAGLTHAAAHGAETRIIRLSALKFRACEGYYSVSARACTWPCSITQMDPNDELEMLYESFVSWCDVALFATPIRWGAASSLFYRMAERLNCVQNQVTIADRVLLRNKVVGLLITGGQDNIQGVAGHMLNFFGELGCHFPQFPYVAHSRGWSAEDMEQNVRMVQHSAELREGTHQLVRRCMDAAQTLIDHQRDTSAVARGGRKAHRLAH